MNSDRFLAITASDAWLTVEQILQVLETAGYWRWGDRYVSPEARLRWVHTRLVTLRGASGAPLFARVEIQGADGQSVSVYKQEWLFNPTCPRPSAVVLSDDVAPLSSARAMTRRLSPRPARGRTALGRRSA